MEFRILGPLEVRDQQGPLPLGGAKPRAVLAVLLLHANAAVSAERLAQALWGEDVPPRAVKTVQVHVSRLRKALGDDDVIETSPAGYRLRVEPGELDAERFERQVAEGRRALAAGDCETAAAALRAALDEWRGPALADLAGEPFAQAEIARLEEHRLTAVEARVEADLGLDRDAELIGELQRLVAAHPSRERLAGQLMLALYRCGRQEEALEAYREARGRLVSEIGIEPGPDLRRLHDAILHQDQSLLGGPPSELPTELERATALPLEGRAEELAWLQRRWRDVRAGSGALITLRGEPGIGKSRLAAEFAADAHAHGAAVLYVDAAGPPAPALDAITRARETPRPTVLVVDDADQAPAPVRAELAALGSGVCDRPVLALLLDANGGGDWGDEEALLLRPLDGDAVHAIVTRYVPPDLSEPPDAWVLGESRGVPRLIHELAGQWARREAARRVELGAERTAAGRAGLRALERELAADVVVLEAASERQPLEAPTEVCPFKGLASFQVADAPYFFGRERLVAELVARLVGAPLLGIVGPSGSGKSSVLRAGLLPALASGVLPGSEHAPQLLIRPGTHPLRELRSALRRVREGPVVLAVDQFEETFTLCADERERAEFVAELTRLARARDGGGAIALAMRADFYGRCAEYPELSRLLSNSHVLVGAMHADELRRAVECPAQRAGLVVDPELADALVHDVEGEPGALPLLSTALLELWQHRDGRRLRHAAYERAGGVRGAVARLGEDAYSRLDDSQRTVARRVLLRLASIDDDGSVERRRVAPAELGGPDAAEVIGLLADSRLLTVHAGTVELAHEALLREWPRLRGWISEDQESLRVQRGLSAEAREWVRLDRDDGALLRGARLAEARETLEPDALADFEREYLTASVERAERERKARRRRVEIVIGALAVGVVTIGVIALMAINQRNDARSRALALRSSQTLQTDPELALRLALWADEISHTAPAAAALRQATLEYRRLGTLEADSQSANTASYSPDGTRIVTGGDDGVALLWDARTHKRLGRLAQKLGPLLSARYAGDGKRIALGFQQGVVVTDARLGDARRLLTPADEVSVVRVAISPDGEQIAAGLDDGSVRVIGPAGEIPVGAGSPVTGVDIDADHVAIARDDGTVELWSPDGTGAALPLDTGGVAQYAIDLSPDGRRVLGAGSDGKARLWSTGSGKTEATVDAGTRSLNAGAFSPDGRRFATGGLDGEVKIWSVAGLSQLFDLRGQLSGVMDAGFGAGADRVVSAGDDGRVRIWNTGGLTTFKVPGAVANIEFDRTGRQIASGDFYDGSVRVWDARTGHEERSLQLGEGYTPVRFSPIANELLLGEATTGNVMLWPLADPRPHTIASVGKDSGGVVVRFDPSGTKAVYSGVSRADSFAVRDLRSGHEVHLGRAPKGIYDARVSPGGVYAAAATESGVLPVWRLDHPSAPYRHLRGHRSHINTIDFAADGRIVTTGDDRSVRVWNPRTGSQIELLGHTNELLTAIFTRDGRRVISTSADGTVRLWNASGGEALAVLQEGTSPIYDVFVANSGTIATVDGNNVVRVYRCTVCGDIQQVRERARALHPRELTHEERERFSAEAG